MSGSPPETGSPVPGVQSSMPMRALASRSAGVSTSTSGGRTAMGPPSLIDDQATAPTATHRTSASARRSFLMQVPAS
jgi:hypothetical protein